MTDEPPIEKPLTYKGRAANSNQENRFADYSREPIDDGWGNLAEELPPLKTELMVDNTQTIINYINSPDLPFDRTLNPYRGCEHGCIYCYARPTHAYLGYSAGLDFESKLLMKADAVSLLKKELAKSSYKCASIALGMNTDAYQPVEKTQRLTRSIIEVLSEANHPFSLVTKSSMVERDIDLIAPMAAKGLASIWVSITSLDNTISRFMEPRAAAPERRFETLRKLHDAGIPTGVMVAPIIPALTDAYMEKILQRAHAVGVRKAGYVFIRLPMELHDLFENWLEKHYPLKAQHVMNLIKQSRGGKVYQSEFGQRMTGEGVFAEMLAKRFTVTCKKLGIAGERLSLNSQLFSIPEAWKLELQQQKNSQQMQLF